MDAIVAIGFSTAIWVIIIWMFTDGIFTQDTLHHTIAMEGIPGLLLFGWILPCVIEYRYSLYPCNFIGLGIALPIGLLYGAYRAYCAYVLPLEGLSCTLKDIFSSHQGPIYCDFYGVEYVVHMHFR